MLDFTVAIPTYNGENRLKEVLDRLRSQIDIENISWEIIVVDNNSSDRTAELIKEYQANWLQPYPLKYCFESRQGAAFARWRAVEAAESQLIGFLDDDNLPTSKWVAAAVKFGKEHPQAGAYGSQIHPEYEQMPPSNFEKIAPFLAITERGNQACLYTLKKRILPPSAGLVTRKQVWLNHVPPQPILSGRIPGSMITGEDLEAIRSIQLAGWEIWYNPAMEIDHKIPLWRLQKEYLLPFFQGIGLGRHVIRMLGLKSWQKPLFFLLHFIYDSYKMMLHLLKYGNKMNTDLVVACQWKLLLYSFCSPFYFWRKG